MGKSTVAHIFFIDENFCKIIIFRLLLIARKIENPIFGGKGLLQDVGR